MVVVLVGLGSCLLGFVSLVVWLWCCACNLLLLQNYVFIFFVSPFVKYDFLFGFCLGGVPNFLLCFFEFVLRVFHVCCCLHGFVLRCLFLIYCIVVVVLLLLLLFISRVSFAIRVLKPKCGFQNPHLGFKTHIYTSTKPDFGFKTRISKPGFMKCKCAYKV